MTHFIKLSRYIINIKHIQTIETQPNKYIINFFMGNGLEICRFPNSEDFDIITNYIKTI